MPPAPTGTVNSAPMLAFTATGSYGSADGPIRMTPVRADRARGPDDRADVARVARRMQRGEQPMPVPTGRSGQRGGADRDDRGQARRAVPVGYPRRTTRPTAGPPGRPRPPARRPSRRAPGWRSRSGATISDVDLGASLDGLPHGLDALHHERGLAPPVLPVGERPDTLDQRVRRAADHLGHRQPSLLCARRAALQLALL